MRRQGGQPESITIAEREVVSEDNEWVQENSFEVNAWSSDGCLLLASQVEAQGDWDETTPIVYDFNSGQHWRSPSAVREVHPRRLLRCLPTTGLCARWKSSDFCHVNRR